MTLAQNMGLTDGAGNDSDDVATGEIENPKWNN